MKSRIYCISPLLSATQRGTCHRWSGDHLSGRSYPSRVSYSVRTTVLCVFCLSLWAPSIPVWVHGKWYHTYIEYLLTAPRPAILDSLRLATSPFSSWSQASNPGGSTLSSCVTDVYTIQYLSFLLPSRVSLLDGLLPHPDTAASVPFSASPGHFDIRR
jgi:hypothetical protein